MDDREPQAQLFHPVNDRESGQTWWYDPNGYNGGAWWTYEVENEEESTNWAIWGTYIETPGTYVVQVYWPESGEAEATTQAWYRIYSGRAGLVDEVWVDQEASGGEWSTLGVYDFPEGPTVVLLTDWAGIVPSIARAAVEQEVEPPRVYFDAVLNRLEEATGQILRWMVLGLLLTVVVLNWAEFSTVLYAGIPSKVQSLKVILFGPFWWVFWIINVGLGLVVPLLLLVFAGRSKVALTVAGGLIAFTAISTKLNPVIPALVVPEFEGLRTAFSGLGLTFDYFPTSAEWLVTVWVVSIAGGIFLALYQFLPTPVDEQAG